jgi:hypothetical protein
MNDESGDVPTEEPTPGDRSNPFDRVVDAWEEVVEDMGATAAALRESGYEVVELHPGDVTAVDGRLDVLVPNDEFDRLRETATDGMDEAQVFRAERGGMVYALAVVTDPGAGVGVCCPVYYEADRAGDLADGGVAMRVRALSEETPVVVTVEDGSLFRPGGDGAGAGPGSDPHTGE